MKQLKKIDVVSILQIFHFIFMKNHVRIDNEKLEEVMRCTLSSLEEPLVAAPCDWTIKKNHTPKNGIILITQGSIYLFRIKLIKPMVLEKKVHFLDIRTIRIATHKMILELDDVNVEMITKDIPQIHRAISFVTQSATFGVANLKLFNVVSNQPLAAYTVQERPPKALELRWIFLANFYNNSRERIKSTSYFNSWESSRSKTLVINASFHPNTQAVSIGHAIGWEFLLNTVRFDNFSQPHFGKMLAAMIENAQTIKRVIFTHIKSESVPRFDNEIITHNTIDTWYFIDVCAEFVNSFVVYSKFLPQPITTLLFDMVPFTAPSLQTFISNLGVSPSILGIKNLVIQRNNEKIFPSQEALSVANMCTSLTSLTIAGVGGDGTRILSTLFKCSTKISTLSVINVQFISEFPETGPFPSELVSLDISNSAFTPKSFASLLKYVASQDLIVPIIFKATDLVVPPTIFDNLAYLKIEDLNPSIAEFIYSGNIIPESNQLHLLRFLSSQKRLRLLSLHDMEPQNPESFAHALGEFVRSSPIAGIELSGRFMGDDIANFLSLLRDSRSIIRLSIKGCGSSDEGLILLNEIVRSLPYLAEFQFDGFKPETKKYIFEIFESIVMMTNVVSFNVPQQDLKELKANIANFGNDELIIYNNVNARKRLSTMKQRELFVEEMIQKQKSSEGKLTKSFIITPDAVFKNASYIKEPASEYDHEENIRLNSFMPAEPIE